MLYFITSNKDKIVSAKHKLAKYGISFEARSFDFVEPQIDSVEEIAKIKVEQAFKSLKSGVFVTDVEWRIPSLNNFPGPYMNYVIRRFENEDYLNLMRNKEDRRIIYEVYLVYKDDKNLKVFSYRNEGEFLTEERGKAPSFSLDEIITFRKDGKSLAECKSENLPVSGYERRTEWEMLGEWLITSKE